MLPSSIILLIAFLGPSLGEDPYRQTSKNGKEVPRLGHACTQTVECEFENSECLEDQCLCKPQYVRSRFHEEEDVCVPEIIYMTTDYEIKNLHWTDKLSDRTSDEHRALEERLESIVQDQTGKFFVDLKMTYFKPTKDGMVSANLWFHLKNPLLQKQKRTTRSVEQPEDIKVRDERMLPANFFADLAAKIAAAAAAAGKTGTTVTSTLAEPCLGDFCEDDDDCSHITNAACMSSTCMCIDGYVAKPDSCDECLEEVPKGQPCTDTVQCDMNQECDTNCDCVDGAVPIMSDQHCGMEAAVDGMCMVDAQCTKTLGTTCENICDAAGNNCGTVCTCEPQFQRTGDECSGAPTTTPQPCTGGVLQGFCEEPRCPCNQTLNLKCENGVCICEVTHKAVNGICEERKNLGEACTMDEVCPDLAACTSDLCACSDTAVEVVGVACFIKAQLGEACEHNQQCQPTNSDCTGGVCACHDPYAKSIENPNTCVPKTVRSQLSHGWTWTEGADDPASEGYSAAKIALENFLRNSANLTFTSLDDLTVVNSGGGAAVVTYILVLPNPDAETRFRRAMDATQNQVPVGKRSTILTGDLMNQKDGSGVEKQFSLSEDELLILHRDEVGFGKRIKRDAPQISGEIHVKFL